MIRFLFYLFVIFFISVGVNVYLNSQRTFQAKFKNIDGLPKGARVTALGVQIGEVVRTKPVDDGIIVTVKITNESAPQPPAGSELAITSFRPSQGRVLEVIPPVETNKDRAYIVQEPISTDSWLHASLYLLEGLESFSRTIIKFVTPENFQKVRTLLSNASYSLNEAAESQIEHQEELTNLKDRISKKANEANELLSSLQKPINSVNMTLGDKDLTSSLKAELSDFSKDLSDISQKISDPEFTSHIKNFKSETLANINQVRDSLNILDKTVNNAELTQKIKEFNKNVENLNLFYSKVEQNNVGGIVKEKVVKIREITDKASKISSMLIKKDD